MFVTHLWYLFFFHSLSYSSRHVKIEAAEDISHWHLLLDKAWHKNVKDINEVKAYIFKDEGITHVSVRLVVLIASFFSLFFHMSCLMKVYCVQYQRHIKECWQEIEDEVSAVVSMAMMEKWDYKERNTDRTPLFLGIWGRKMRSNDIEYNMMLNLLML